MFFQKLKIENINQTKQGETNIFLNQHAEYCVGRIAFILTGRQPNECVCVGALMHSEQVLTIFFLDLHISNLLNNIIFLCMYYVFFWKYTIARTLVSICSLSLSNCVYHSDSASTFIYLLCWERTKQFDGICIHFL